MAASSLTRTAITPRSPTSPACRWCRTTSEIGTPAAPLEIPVTQWRTNLYGRIFLDQNGDNASQPDEPGLPLVPYNIRDRNACCSAGDSRDAVAHQSLWPHLP